MITRGKWHAGDAGLKVYSQDGHGICALDIYKIPIKEAQHNAQAISCLPDMIEALQAINAEMEWVGDQLVLYPDELSDAVIKVRQALQKAGITAIDGV